MFRNLIAEMARAGYTYKAMAEEIGIGEVAYSKKVNGKTNWTVTEMVIIQDILNKKLGTSYTLDYLFMKS